MAPKKNQWTLPGMCFNTANPNKPKSASISFPCGQNVLMPGPKTHSGQAVDADVAALFINNFYSYYTLTLNSEPKEIDLKKPLAEFESLEAQHTALTAKHTALIDHHKALRKHHTKIKKISKNLVNMTYGMTLDKDMLLHVLGQQECEGIRFYLCGREVKGKKMHLSLVAVGVDKDGFDLNYNKQSGRPIKQLMAGLNSIPTDSVTIEYTTPPPPNDSGTGINRSGVLTPAVEIDEHYALLKLARGNQSPDFKTDSSFELI
jgi:hypothetical protein